ncbi:hypothetical protein FHX52_4329 [Humibacillus xanthopallidus]|uniref:Phospholipase D-like protein n=1 Tax=Humibacillus xanthopallidus TaxID=412689 RepID=A0A543PM00_9MICO|nr:SHOCT domain-containing protein [Humibacillus xanthopallidus]TQN45097.1 hypothetical protein FHX52_4329 [Humibacillus xanthopallidus]
MSFWEIVWFIFIFFAFMAYLMVIFQVIGDLFRDDSVSGWIKAVWIIALIFLPFLTLLLYLIIRGRGMSERTAAAITSARQAQDEYVRSVAGSGASGPEQIAKAKELLDSGAITAEEFAALKAKALA